MPKRKPLNVSAIASAAVPRPDPVEAAIAPALKPVAEPTQPSRAGKVQIQGYFTKETRRQLKTLAARQDRTMEEILGEAITDLLAKYNGIV